MKLNYLFLLICCVKGLLAEDYCTIEGCPNRTHIGCGADDNFKSTCPVGATFIDLSLYSDLIADEHSKLRQTVANGNLPGFPKAANLCEVKYDAELAKVAKYHVLACKIGHDCRKTTRFPWSGQNIYIKSDSTFTGTDEQIRQAIRDAINKWLSEYLNTSEDFKQTLIYPASGLEKVICHFSVMANYKACLVGCAMYYVNKKNVQITCNYSYTNLLTRRTYIPTDTPGSSCKTTSTKYPGLCGNEEHTDFRYKADD